MEQVADHPADVGGYDGEGHDDGALWAPDQRADMLCSGRDQQGGSKVELVRRG